MPEMADFLCVLCGSVLAVRPSEQKYHSSRKTGPDAGWLMAILAG